MAKGPDLRNTGARVESLLEEFRSSADPLAGERADEMVRLLVELYGAGLARFVEMIGEDSTGPALLDRMVGDELVASLLMLHDLHPQDTETRVLAALEKVRPYLGSHAGGVEYLGIDANDAVHLRLEGSCHGCPSSTVTVRMAIERAIEEAAPEVTAIEVEGVADPPPSPLLQIQSRPGLAEPPGHSQAGQPDPASAEAEWTSVDGLADLPVGAGRSVTVDGSAIVVWRLGETLYAYRDGCPACGAELASGGLADTVLTCPGCGTRYDVRLAGRGLDGTDHLDPVPLLADDSSDSGTVRLAVVAEALR